MDYQRVHCTRLTILYFLGLRLGSYLSTIGSTYLTVVLLPVRPIYHGTRKHYSVQNVLCERIPDVEQCVKNHEETVIKRYKTLDFQILVSIPFVKIITT